MKRLFLSGLSCIFLFTGCMPTHPTDERMIAHFEANKPAFENLVQRIDEHGLQFVSRGYDDPIARPVSLYQKEFVEEMIGELKRLGLHAINEDIDDEFGVKLSVKGRDNFLTTFSSDAQFSGKGYVFFENPPNFIVDSLDSIEKQFDGYYYRHIEHGWYLYLTDYDS